MKIPLDYICIKSGVLCPRCRKLIESGEVAEYEVDVIRSLIELEEKEQQFRFLRDTSYIKTYRVDDLYIVILEMPDNVHSHMIARLSRALSDKLGARVKVIRKSNDVKNVIAQILSPARIQGINTVWLPDGSVQHIVRIPRYDARYLPASIESLEKLFREMFNEVFRIRIV